MFLLCATILNAITPSYAFDLALRASPDTCPEAYKQCESSGLSESFCCPSSSKCMGLDHSSSVICCPEGETCAFIQTISCDVQQQNGTLHPKNPVHTTRFDDELPRCGGSCCPFGYECQGGSVCALNNSTASSSSSESSRASSTSTFSLAIASTLTASATSTTSASTTSETPKSTSTTKDSTEETSSSDAITIIPTTPAKSKASDHTSPSSSSSSSSSSSYPSALAGTAITASDDHNCPSFPTGAVLAGFFPGAVFGAVLTALVVYCLRRRRANLPPSAKVAHFTERTSNGTVVGISDPIPSDDTAMRTDFLLRRGDSDSNNTVGAQPRESRLHRTRSRVKSFLSNHSQPRPEEHDTPLVPPLPLPVKAHDGHHYRHPPPQLQTAYKPSDLSHQPSMESTRVYTPPSELFNTPEFLKHDPYLYPPGGAGSKRDTTFTELIDRVGFRNGKGDPCYRVDGGKY